jgi:hypothetical protein
MLLALQVWDAEKQAIYKSYGLAFYEYSPNFGPYLWLFHSLELLENLLNTSMRTPCLINLGPYVHEHVCTRCAHAGA